MKLRYLLIALILLSFTSLFIGVKDISPLEVLNLNDDKVQIMLQSRFPRLITIIIAGAVMSIGGLIMQQLSHNKFVSPTTAGTMDSARLGLLDCDDSFSNCSASAKNVDCFCFFTSWDINFHEKFWKK